VTDPKDLFEFNEQQYAQLKYPTGVERSQETWGPAPILPNKVQPERRDLTPRGRAIREEYGELDRLGAVPPGLTRLGGCDILSLIARCYDRGFQEGQAALAA